MPITIQQVPTALTAIGQIVNELNSMVSLLNEAQILSNNGWSITLSPGMTIAITADQQTAIVSQYDNLKNQLVTTFQNLP